MTLMFGLEKNFRYKSHIVRFTPIGNYAHLLDDAARAPTMLYDLGSKRCWLVPKLRLILHMCQAYATANSVPFVAPHVDASAIISDLSPIGGIVIMADEGGDFLFRHLMHQISTNLMLTRHSTKSSKKKKLYGFEFRDVVHQPDRGAYMREMELQPAGEAWSKLANAVDAVIVCKDAGDVITKTNVPMQCSTLPEGCDYLAVPMNMLEILAKRRGGSIFECPQEITLGKGAIWDIESNPFTPCTHSGNDKGSCWEKNEVWQDIRRDSARERKFQQKFQQLISASGNVERNWEKLSELLSLRKEAPAPMDKTQLAKTGVVVFGKRDG
jgi:hypothetical protein